MYCAAVLFLYLPFTSAVLHGTACSARARVFSVWISGRVSPRRVNRQVGMPYITHGFLRADSRNSMGFILLYGKKNVSRYGFRHSVLEATRRPVCHVILQRCAGRDMLDDAAAEAQLAEADELLTAVLFVPMGGKFFRFLVIVKVFAGFCLRTRKKMI